MGWVRQWQRCKHEAAEWSPQTFSRGGNRWWRYSVARCVHCGRPLVAFAPGFPTDEHTPTRRHVAWEFLDKEGEHASNTAVLPWSATRETA